MADIETKLDIILAAIRSIQGELEEVKETDWRAGRESNGFRLAR
jgi:hypothetical protein